MYLFFRTRASAESCDESYYNFKHAKKKSGILEIGVRQEREREFRKIRFLVVCSWRKSNQALTEVSVNLARGTDAMRTNVRDHTRAHTFVYRMHMMRMCLYLLGQSRGREVDVVGIFGRCCRCYVRQDHQASFERPDLIGPRSRTRKSRGLRFASICTETMTDKKV